LWAGWFVRWGVYALVAAQVWAGRAGVAPADGPFGDARIRVTVR